MLEKKINSSTMVTSYSYDPFWPSDYEKDFKKSTGIRKMTTMTDFD
jgi:hypothetical protein